MSLKEDNLSKPNGVKTKIPAAPRLTLVVCLALIILNLIVYGQVIGIFSGMKGFPLIRYDDPTYLTQNPNVQQFTLKTITWAFTSGYAQNWHPLTWISHMIDCAVFGANSTGHHFTSILIHIANTLLLFFLLRKMTGFTLRSAFVAALFAVHPLHVESVAWVSERKDVLCAFFWLLAMLAYVYYAKRPSLKRYALVFISLALSLLSKPMAVTFPLALLLIDYWPLGRLNRTNIGKLILEKVPLFVLITGSSIATFMAQKQGGAVWSEIPLSLRIENAIVTYVEYLSKTFWPMKMGMFYPFPENGIALWKTAGALLLLLLITYAALRLRKKHPYLITGWAWYLITLVPVIGIIQVGAKSMADRYTYIPLIGIFFAAAWLLPDALQRGRPSLMLRTFAAAAVIALTISGNVQTGYWKDTATLFEHTLKATTENYAIHSFYGDLLVIKNRSEEALYHFKESVRIDPEYAEGYFKIGEIYAKQGRLAEASEEFRRALDIIPDYSAANYNLALILAIDGKTEEASEHLKKALSVFSNYEEKSTEVIRGYYDNGDFRNAWELIQVMKKAGAAPPADIENELSLIFTADKT